MSRVTKANILEHHQRYKIIKVKKKLKSLQGRVKTTMHINITQLKLQK